MLIQDHPFWSKLLLTPEVYDVAQATRNSITTGQALDVGKMKVASVAHAERIRSLAEKILPLIQEEVRTAPTKLDETVERWFRQACVAKFVARKAMPSTADMAPEPDSPLGRLLHEKLAKWKAAIDGEAPEPKPSKGPVLEDEHHRRLFNTKKANSRAEALVAEALAADEEYIETEARRRYAEEQQEKKIRARIAMLLKGVQHVLPIDLDTLGGMS